MAAEGETVALEFIPIAERCLQYLGKLKKKAVKEGAPFLLIFALTLITGGQEDCMPLGIMVYGYEKHLNN
ncbi:hypothetical protein ZEAMMB73_Zm00001d001926 [Zea mays]|uniref:Uncharacterized protein n=1 Tax=Zea mays TaxID=4577 RepID=A0A1D6DUF7_MAIZE|nr:hypothetical protein ZEAMMB73_Zm00001d018317 [Zea mays]ONM12467.1 hypothetical protein ZEAMMB73_Zm00001d001926 [Zea mays]ONM12468.1 hypothetical protein ZEAMMB73_Zm00001d001926 [Zea mays]